MNPSSKSLSFENQECLYNHDSYILYDKISGILRDHVEVYLPKNRKELKKLIVDANSNNNPFSVVSCGRNWGYGGMLPAQNNNKVINLCQMNQILSFNETTGVAHIEAGVTQGQLEKFLCENGYNFYVPNTGAGPEGSIIGNALERGFGLSPIEDHAEALLAINGYYSDGTEFAPALDEVDPQLSACFPHGIGPCLSKLAPQSSWIIATDAKIQLAQRRSNQVLFMTTFSEDRWAQVVSFLQTIGLRQDLPVKGFKIINQRQIGLSSSSNPSLKSQSTWFQKLTNHKEWVLLFFLRCEPGITRALKKEIRCILSENQLQSFIWTNCRIKLFQKILKFLPFQAFAPVKTALLDLSEFYQLGDGKTSWVGHKVRSENEGLIWMSPLCPITSERVHSLKNLTKNWGGGDTLRVKTWTWTVLNPRTFALVMPLVFDKSISQQKAWDDYHKKLEELRKEGFVPYRYPIETMNYLKNKVAPQYFKKVSQLDMALDPSQLLNAGRYS